MPLPHHLHGGTEILAVRALVFGCVGIGRVRTGRASVLEVQVQAGVFAYDSES
ncbi:hypothetical protein [Streptomyces venezuelae]|uniref:hypothetical protein n=1 Tax=Streptomyces venezuelae TaxID=54571 RepID=UPI00365ACAF4